MAIWQRYFLKQFMSMFLLFLFCFYGLYVLIDYASHTSAISNHHVQIQWTEAVRYYFYVFANRSEILLPLAILIAFVHTVCSLNSHQELVALMASGFNLKLLMRPFLIVGFLGVILMYANEEFLKPQALKKIRKIEDTAKQQRHRHTPSLSVRQVMLEDGTLLIFQDYDVAKNQFFDVYWIQSINSIYRMKYLALPTPISLHSIGYYVDHMLRQSNGELLQESAYLKYDFPTITFKPELLHLTVDEPDVLSISDLATQVYAIPSKPNEKECKTLTALYWKLSLPWMCLLAILAPAPFCTVFSRQLPIFLIYTCSLFGLIAFYMFMDAAQVIAKRQVCAPSWAILTPFISVVGYFYWRFIRIE